MVRIGFDRCEYVPQMRKNIIPVGGVKSKELKVTLENEILKAMKRSLVVIKGNRDSNLYYLKDSTVTSSLTASVFSDIDATQLMHIDLVMQVRSLSVSYTHLTLPTIYSV